MKPVIPLTLIAFCFTLIVGTLTAPFNTTAQVGAVSFSAESDLRERARDVALADVISFKQSTIQTREGARVKVTLTSSGPIQETTRVKVKIAGGTAKNGTDYRLPSVQTITFYKGGLREKSFLIPTLTDRVTEQTETIILSLYSSTDQSLDKKTTISIGNGAVSPTTPNTGGSTVVQQVNLNAIPADTALDANGWPRYLKVPATCARPVAGKRYIFEPRHGGHVADPLSNKNVGPYLVGGLGGSSGDYSISLTDDEVMIMPYYAPYLASIAETPKTRSAIARLGDIATGYATQYWAPHVAYGNQMRINVSKCPGGENPIVSAGPSGYGTLVTAITVDGERTSTANGGNLNQGGYYFVNFSGTCERGDPSDPASTTGIYARNGKPLCASIMQSYGSYDGASLPPYTGPLLANGPYPINYNDKIVAFANSHTGSDAWRSRCFDVTGRGPEMRYEITSRGWTEPNKPAYSNYICASIAETQSRPGSFEDVPVYKVCAKHSAGYTRTSRVSLFGVPLQHVDSCQFDTTKGVYYWKTTSPSNSVLSLLDQSTQTGAYNFTTAWNGTPGIVEYKDASGTLIKSERFH